MNLTVFAAAHSLFLILLIITPQILLHSDTETNTSIKHSIGLIIIQITFILAAELATIALSILIKQRAGQFLRLAWAVLTIPLALFVIADFGVFTAGGSHLDLNTIRFALTHGRDLAPIIFSENNAAAWTIALLAIILGLGLSAAGWKTRLLKHCRTYAAITMTISLLFLTGTAASICRDTNPVSSDTIYSLIHLTCAPATQSSNAKAIPIITKLKLAQLIRQGTNSGQITSPTEKLSSAPPPNLQTTANSTLDNIVTVILESTRRDAITPYNHNLDTTPFLQTMAEEGMTVSDAYVNYAYTSKSLVAIPCGIPPNPTLAITESEPDGILQPCLPHLLKPLGYRSAFFMSSHSGFENGQQLAANVGYDTYMSQENLDPTGWETVNYFGLEERAMTKPIMRWVDQQRTPFLLTILTLSSHHPFQPPPSFPKKTYPGPQQWSDYLNTIRYVDSFLAELFNEFEQRGLAENTLFVFTADHGTDVSFRDHRRPFQENILTPLILWHKGLIPRSTVVSGLRQHTDIVPTIVDLLELETTEGSFYGTSLRQPAGDRTIPVTCKFNLCLGHVTSEFKFFHYDDGNQSELYDLAEDPQDNNNLASLLPPALTEKYVHELKRWQGEISKIYDKQRVAQGSDVRGAQSTDTTRDITFVDARLTGDLQPGRQARLTLIVKPGAESSSEKYELEIVDANRSRTPLSTRRATLPKTADSYSNKAATEIEFTFTVPEQAAPGAAYILVKPASGQQTPLIPAWIN